MSVNERVIERQQVDTLTAPLTSTIVELCVQRLSDGSAAFNVRARIAGSQEIVCRAHDLQHGEQVVTDLLDVLKNFSLE